MNSIIIPILDYGIIIMSSLSFSSACAAIVVAYFKSGFSTSIKVCIARSIIIFIDCIILFVSNFILSINGAVNWIFALSLLADFLLNTVIIFIAAFLVHLIFRKNKSWNDFDSLLDFKNPPQKAIFSLCIYYFLIKFISELTYTVSFLFDVGFELYDGELATIISTYVSIIIINGIIPIFVITLLCLLITKLSTEKHNLT